MMHQRTRAHVHNNEVERSLPAPRSQPCSVWGRLWLVTPAQPPYFAPQQCAAADRTETRPTRQARGKPSQDGQRRRGSGHSRQARDLVGVNYCVHMQGTSAPLERRALKGPLRSARRARCGPGLGGPEAPAWPVVPRRRSAGARPGSRSAAPVKLTPRAQDLTAGASELAVC